MLSGARGLKRRPLAPHPHPRSKTLKILRPLTDVNNSGIMQMPASLRSDLYSHQTGISYSHRRNTQ